MDMLGIYSDGDSTMNTPEKKISDCVDGAADDVKRSPEQCPSGTERHRSSSSSERSVSRSRSKSRSVSSEDKGTELKTIASDRSSTERSSPEKKEHKTSVSPRKKSIEKSRSRSRSTSPKNVVKRHKRKGHRSRSRSCSADHKHRKNSPRRHHSSKHRRKSSRSPHRRPHRRRSKSPQRRKPSRDSPPVSTHRKSRSSSHDSPKRTVDSKLKSSVSETRSSPDTTEEKPSDIQTRIQNLANSGPDAVERERTANREVKRSRSRSRSHHRERSHRRSRSPRRRSHRKQHRHRRSKTPPKHRRRRRSRERSSHDSKRPRHRASKSRSRSRSRSPEKQSFRMKLKAQLLKSSKILAQQEQINSQGADPTQKPEGPKEKPSDLPLLQLDSAMMSKLSHLPPGQIMPQLALLQTMSAMHEKAQEITGVTVPKYYNPAAVNPLRYAETVKKRKMLWAKKPETEQKEGQWQGTAFMSDNDGKVAAKFRKLMGIKEDGQGGTGDFNVEEQQKKRAEMFERLDQDYAFARMTTHTQRGVGLGFQSQMIAQQQQLVPTASPVENSSVPTAQPP